MEPDEWRNKHLAYWDSIAGGYDRLYGSSWSAWENEQVQRLLFKLFANHDGAVLDLGCGTGLGYELVTRCNPGLSYCGVDISPKMIAQFSEKYPGVCVIRAPMSDLSAFTPEQFSFVISLNGAFSFSNAPRVTLREIRRVLKPGGRVFISVYGRFALRRLLRGMLSADERFQTRGAGIGHGTVPCTTYSRAEITHLMSQEGYQIDEIFPQGVLAGVLETARTMEAERLLVRLLPFLSHLINIVGRRHE